MSQMYSLSGFRVLGLKRSIVKVCGDRRDKLASLMSCLEGLNISQWILDLLLVLQLLVSDDSRLSLPSWGNFRHHCHFWNNCKHFFQEIELSFEISILRDNKISAEHTPA